MNTRAIAQAHLRNHFGRSPKNLRTSKYYSTHESWIKRPAWWFDIPIDSIRSEPGGTTYMVGLNADQAVEVVMAVPHSFLQDQEAVFDRTSDGKLRLHIAADGPDRFTEYRQGRGPSFTPYVIP